MGSLTKVILPIKKCGNRNFSLRNYKKVTHTEVHNINDTYHMHQWCQQISRGNPSRHIKGPKVFVEKLIEQCDIIMDIVICGQMPTSIKVKKGWKADIASSLVSMQFLLHGVKFPVYNKYNWTRVNNIKTIAFLTSIA